MFDSKVRIYVFVYCVVLRLILVFILKHTHDTRFYLPGILFARISLSLYLCFTLSMVSVSIASHLQRRFLYTNTHTRILWLKRTRRRRISFDFIQFFSGSLCLVSTFSWFSVAVPCDDFEYIFMILCGVSFLSINTRRDKRVLGGMGYIYMIAASTPPGTTFSSQQSSFGKGCCWERGAPLKLTLRLRKHFV